MIQQGSKRRTWLVRMTTMIALLLMLSFLIVLFRGILWSPQNRDINSSELELGVTTMFKLSNKRVWATRLDEQQRQQFSALHKYVHSGGGCQIQAEVCYIKSVTPKQGVFIIYIKEKPNILAMEVEWIGGFINPNNGAIYDLFGRLYRDSVRKNSLNVDEYINILP